MEKKRTWLRAFHENGDEDEKSRERRLGLRERKRISYTVEGTVHEDEEQESAEEEKDEYKHVSSELPVVCGTKKGLLDVKKLEGGEACITCEGYLLTPPAFECLAGKGTAKKWKASIFYNKKPLQFWFEQGYLSTKGYNKGKRAIQEPEPEKLSDGESEIDFAEETEEEDVKDDDWLSSNDEQALETEEESEDGGKDEAGIENLESDSEDDSLEMLDTEDEDVTDISGNSAAQTANKEDPKVITSTPEKLCVQKEVKIIIKRLSVADSDCQTNLMECPLEDTWNKSLGAGNHSEEVTDNSSATLDDLFFTSAKENQPSLVAGAARTCGFKGKPDRQRGIKTETSSYEEKEDGELEICCGKDSKISKEEHFDMSISQYNIQPRAAEDRDVTSRRVPEQPLIIEKIFQPTPSPVSIPVTVPVHQDHTNVNAHLQGMTSNVCTPQTSQTPEIAEASSRASSGSDVETMDLHQLKKEKIKMQLRVLKLQEEYFILKLDKLKKPQ
ncbi:uncharacterized protein LOC121632619 isoform X2 [Melanotaenia boesemani]|uniref:uncharacterized protein LOC121632619 isoform X2 n=1 Tax=Melanotaenia boesemani TaxID=1250792 RepID=UPI001C04D602|nr:uncharacterized protein LOC121632619 isoform X2 [Melanotaenia boesemani]